MGAHDDQYLQIFYTLYENLLYKLALGVQQRGSMLPVPEGDVRQRWQEGQASQGDKWLEEDFYLPWKKTVGWRSKQAEVGFDVFSIMIDACLSFSNTLCSLFMNKQDV